jgi:hypothetical protein
MTLEFNRMLKKYVSVTLNQVLNLIQDLTISGSRKIPILLDAEIVDPELVSGQGSSMTCWEF